MFQYLLAFLLVTTLSRSLGLPVEPPKQFTSNGALAAKLAALAEGCENKFISNQIRAKLIECDVGVPPYDGKQFECMLFYDINKQLCEAIKASELGLSQDYTGKINEPLNVETTCAVAKNWTFSDIPDYPKYKEIVPKVFNARLGCLKVCAVEDITSTDTNFFCKYYKWGSDILGKNKQEPQLDNVVIQHSMPDKVNSGQDTKPSVPILETKTHNILVSESSGPEVISKPHTELKPGNHTNSQDTQTSDGKKPESSPVNPEVDSGNESGKSDIEVAKNKSLRTETAPSANRPEVVEGMDKPSASDTESHKNDEVEDNNDDTAPPTNNNNIKTNDQGAPDYQDTNEEKDGIDGDDRVDYRDPVPPGDDESKQDTNIQQEKTIKKIEYPGPIIGDRGDKKAKKLKETKLIYEEKEIKPPTKSREKTEISIKADSTIKLISQMNMSTTKKKMYQSALPVDQFGEDDDDHFFPFFLTAVILVVVLYVLYHNKSKVSKMVLGLIVEGRQTGRRRNSRGHAYRRLDTLEQAMSTNSTTPPSKIIY